MFAGREKIVSHSSCRTSAILKYFSPLSLDAKQFSETPDDPFITIDSQAAAEFNLCYFHR